MHYQHIHSLSVAFLSINSAAASPLEPLNIYGHRKQAVWGSNREGSALPQPSSTSVYPVPSVAITGPAVASQTSNGAEGAVAGGANTATGGSSTFDQPNPATISNGTSGPSVSSKKGCGLWHIKEIGASWGYDYSDNPAALFGGSVPAGIDAVPMVNQSTNIAALASTPYAELLGYNEPDGAVPVPVSFAIENWPAIVSTGKRVGAPASAVPRLVSGGWIDQFMTGIAQKGSHVDFMCVHYSGYVAGGDVNKFQDFLQSYYDKYKLPIWVTAWSMINYDVDPPAIPSDEVQVKWMQDAVKMMNGLDIVERYNWEGLPNSKMDLVVDGKLTPEGLAYKAL